MRRRRTFETTQEWLVAINKTEAFCVITLSLQKYIWKFIDFVKLHWIFPKFWQRIDSYRVKLEFLLIKRLFIGKDGKTKVITTLCVIRYKIIIIATYRMVLHILPSKNTQGSTWSNEKFNQTTSDWDFRERSLMWSIQPFNIEDFDWKKNMYGIEATIQNSNEQYSTAKSPLNFVNILSN